MREIVLDTETTGLDCNNGHRIVEIGCVELGNHVPTGAQLHLYVDPEMPMPAVAVEVHGLTDDFLCGKPKFAEVADAFLAFIADSPLIIHNAAFDIGFLNAELARLGRPAIPMTQAVDTVAIARRRYPGQPASLDALCKRFGIDLSQRNLHGALLDAGLLAAVWLELNGGRQPALGLALAAAGTADIASSRPVRPPRPHAASADELAAHAAFVATLTDPLWTALGLLPEDSAAA